MNLIKILVSLFVSLPVLITLSLFVRNPPRDRINAFADARTLQIPSPNPNSSSSAVCERSPSSNFEENGLYRPMAPAQMTKEDKLHGGLVAPGFDEGSCLSKYESSLYRKISPHKPSSYLLSKLRSYEDLHKQCGPHTKSYKSSLKQLKKKSNGKTSTSTTEEYCRYVVWIANNGLGNKMLTIAAAFLYALLTNRVLLLDPGKDMPDLFCEPFPQTSWLLPKHFPIKNQFYEFDQNSPSCYGNMLRKTTNLSELSLPSYVYLHLYFDYGDQDKLFFCDQEQSLLGNVPWLIMKSDNYFVPSLFLMPSYEQELNKLFPEKETVFHHLGTYLFHPSNHVWGLITRYYQAHLAKADQRIGIQIRSFEPQGYGPFQHVMDQILACVFNEKLLPQVKKSKPTVTTPSNPKLKSVLITCLVSEYYEKMRNMYWEYPTVTGDVIAVFQPSHEEYQKTDDQVHDRKTLAEIFLLSFSDVLVTSAKSTFGYVAQSLGNLKPWVLFIPENQTVPNPPCRRVMSLEPCFHAPPFWDCKAKKGIDTGLGLLVPHVRHCEDFSWGLQLVDI